MYLIARQKFVRGSCENRTKSNSDLLAVSREKLKYVVIFTMIQINLLYDAIR